MAWVGRNLKTHPVPVTEGIDICCSPITWTRQKPGVVVTDNYQSPLCACLGKNRMLRSFQPDVTLQSRSVTVSPLHRAVFSSCFSPWSKYCFFFHSSCCWLKASTAVPVLRFFWLNNPKDLGPQLLPHISYWILKLGLAARLALKALNRTLQVLLCVSLSCDKRDSETIEAFSCYCGIDFSTNGTF